MSRNLPVTQGSEFSPLRHEDKNSIWHATMVDPWTDPYAWSTRESIMPGLFLSVAAFYLIPISSAAASSLGPVIPVVIPEYDFKVGPGCTSTQTDRRTADG